MTNHPAGWYPAAHANNELRYWDGNQWVEPPAGTAPTAVMGQPDPEPDGTAKAPKKKLKWWVWVLIVVGGILVLSGLVNALSGGADEDVEPTATPTVVEEPEEEPVTDEPTAEPEPEPVEEDPQPEPEPELTTEQRNAVRSAESYLNFSAFSRSGLIGQLEYEEYSTEVATFAVDYVDPDWNEQAARSAESYLSFTSFSRQGLIDQLIYEGFTPEQAEFGVTAVGY